MNLLYFRTALLSPRVVSCLACIVCTAPGLKSLIELKRNLTAAPFDRAFDALREGRGGSVPPSAIPWRKNEVVYIVPQVCGWVRSLLLLLSVVMPSCDCCCFFFGGGEGEPYRGCLRPALSNKCRGAALSLSPRYFGVFGVFLLICGTRGSTIRGGFRVEGPSCGCISVRSPPCMRRASHFEIAETFAACLVKHNSCCGSRGACGACMVFQADRVAVIFAIDFSESDERAIAKASGHAYSSVYMPPFGVRWLSFEAGGTE